MSGKGLFFFWFSALVVAGAFLMLGCGVDSADAKTPFGYRLIGTYGWVPANPATDALKLSDAFGRTPDMTVFRSSADWRMYLSDSNYMPTGSGIAYTQTMSAASLDTLYGSLGLPAPAAGITYYGRILWAFCASAPDTVWIDGYVVED